MSFHYLGTIECSSCDHDRFPCRYTSHGSPWSLALYTLAGVKLHGLGHMRFSVSEWLKARIGFRVNGLGIVQGSGT